MLHIHSKCKFHVGDRVRIRQWDDMAAQYGIIKSAIYASQHIPFFIQMKELCGFEFDIGMITATNDDGVYRVSPTRESLKCAPKTHDFLGFVGWTITDRMIELVHEAEIDTSEISNYLSALMGGD